MFHTLLLILVFANGPTVARANNDSAGTSSRRAKLEAVNAIPFQQLNQQTQTKINDVIDNASIFRRLPLTSIDVDPDYLVFLVRHPEVVVNIWKLMGVTNMESERTGPFTIESNDGAGTISDIELVYGTRNIHVFYGTGTYEGQIIKRKLNGQCVLVLKTDYSNGPDGKPVATNRLDVFLKIDNTTIGLVAKTLNPIVGPTADHNFVESLKFLQRLNETTEQNGPGVQRMASRLTDVQPDIRREYADISGLVFQRARQHEASQPLPNRPAAISQPTPAIQYQQSITPMNAPQAFNGGYPPSMRQDSNGYLSLTRQIPIYQGRDMIQSGSQGNYSAAPQQQVHQGSYRWAQGVPIQRGQYQAPVYPAQNYYRR